MAKAEVFIPADGQQYVAPGIVDAKLNKLLEVFPNDYQLYLFKGYQYQQKLDFSNAQAAFEHSVELNPKFVYGYLALGSNNQLHLKGDDESTHKTIEYYQKALELDPDNADAYNNLGYMYLFLGEFNPAYTNLNRANTLSPTFDTTLGLGDVYNYLGDSGNALRLHQWILYILSEPSMENDETFLSASLLYNYMPEQPGDTASISNYVTVNTMSDKRILLHYTLSYDYALTKKFDEADLEFGTAYQMDGSHQYNDFFRNKLTSLKNFLNPDQDVQGWLDTHIALLS